MDLHWRWPIVQLVIVLGVCGGTIACSDDDDDDGEPDFVPAEGGGTTPPETPSCEAAAEGSASVAAPELLLTLFDRWDEGWLGSPAIADLEGDGVNEVVLPRGERLYAFNADGSIKWMLEDLPGRIWASAVVADFRDDAALETVVASRERVYMLDAAGNVMPGFPVDWEDELRSLGAGDINGDGRPEIVVASTRSGGQEDVVSAIDASGATVTGFPPLETGSSGCEVDDRCYIAGAYDQNVAVGDLDGDGNEDIVVPQDNAYVSIHHGTGEAFDTAAEFPSAKSPGLRYLHDLELAQQGWADDEDTALQAHFTNTPPAIADLDQDGTYEVILLASVQNAAQSDREQGVALWVVGPDGARRAGFEQPFHAPDYLIGLGDLGNNIVGVTNQATVADINADRAGLEVVFAGFDGRIHAVDATGTQIWQWTYTTQDTVLTGGVVVGDLSGDGIPEIVFNTYSVDDDDGALFILDAGGNPLHEIPLPRRGAMAVPTLGDLDGDGQLDIVVSLKDAEDGVESALVYTVPGASDNCLLWPTGRGNLLRNGWVLSE